jgi:hypothetical protein
VTLQVAGKARFPQVQAAVSAGNENLALELELQGFRYATVETSEDTVERLCDGQRQRGCPTPKGSLAEPARARFR